MSTEVAQVAAELVQLPQNECVAKLKRLQAGGEAGPGVTATRSELLVDGSGSTPAASKASRYGDSVCERSDFETWT